MRAATASFTSAAYFSCLLFTAAVAGGGCVSNEYRISRDELQRLAQTPLETRGRDVHVVQELGARRAEEVEPPTQDQLNEAWQPVYLESQQPYDGDGPDLNLQLDGAAGQPRPRRAAHPRGLQRPGDRNGGSAHGTAAVAARGSGDGSMSRDAISVSRALQPARVHRQAGARLPGGPVQLQVQIGSVAVVGLLRFDVDRLPGLV